MADNLHRYLSQFKYLIASIIIVLSSSVVAINLPAEDHYYKQADEGNYYRQGKILVENGFSGFKIITDDYLNTPALQDAPSPFRIGANTLIGLALTVDDSYFSISVLSLLCFVIFLVGTFYFVDRCWGAVVALLCLLLLAFSPLEMAMARRALMDMPAMMVLAFSCYAFWGWIDTKRRRYLASFISLTVTSILLKEVNVIFLLFFAMILIDAKRRNRNSIPIGESLAAILLPAVVVGFFYLAVFGVDDGVKLFKTMYNAVSHSAYSATYGQGPWYRILIDYLMLSPYVVILAVGYAWHYLLHQDSDRKTNYMLALGFFMIVAFSLLPKNVRYAIFFDVPLRFLAVNGLLVLLSRLYQRKWTWQVVVLIVFLVFTDLNSFYTYFIDHGIYDPVSNNLLKVNRIIPGP